MKRPKKNLIEYKCARCGATVTRVSGRDTNRYELCSCCRNNENERYTRDMNYGTR